LVSFGGKKDAVGAFYLGRASGFDSLVPLLQKVGVSPPDVEMALQVLTAHGHHEIPDVTLTPRSDPRTRLVAPTPTTELDITGHDTREAPRRPLSRPDPDHPTR